MRAKAASNASLVTGLATKSSIPAARKRF
jgi:hypothetical protein